jgi:cyclopropane fatty-acyl-phospholipid synthase-like methyltransferase
MRKQQREQLNEWYGEDYFRTYPLHARRIAQILHYLPLAPDDRVCEFGCGLGHILFAIQSRIAYGLGIDFSKFAINSAERDRKARGLNNLEFRAADIEGLPENVELKNRFTKVLMMDISEHLYDDTMTKFLAAARHVLVPGGRLYIHTPNATYYLEQMKAHNFIIKQFPSHIAVRNQTAYQQLLERSGFRLSHIQTLPHYNRVLGLLDRFLMSWPFAGRLFEARLLIEATSKQ